MIAEVGNFTFFLYESPNRSTGIVYACCASLKGRLDLKESSPLQIMIVQHILASLRLKNSGGAYLRFLEHYLILGLDISRSMGRMMIQNNWPHRINLYYHLPKRFGHRIKDQSENKMKTSSHPSGIPYFINIKQRFPPLREISNADKCLFLFLMNCC